MIVHVGGGGVDAKLAKFVNVNLNPRICEMCKREYKPELGLDDPIDVIGDRWNVRSAVAPEFFLDPSTVK